MASFCGIFSYRGFAVLDAEIKTGLKVLSSKPDLSDFFLWSDKNVGLGETPCSPQNGLLRDKSKQLLIVGDVSLRNRTELLAGFGVSSLNQKDFSDGQIVLKCYQEWGDKCPEHLVGDFSFVIWDAATHKLFACRDHLGASTLFFFRDSEKFVFASRPRGIFAFGKIGKTLNKKKPAIFLFREPHTYLSDQTWYENIFPCPAGTCLTVDENGIQSRQFWNPKPVRSLPYQKDEDVLAAFRELFFEVISSHLSDNPVPAALLSGGLDSSSIVAVAAKILERQNREINVLAGVMPEADGGRFPDERYYIDQFRSIENVRINYVTAPDTGPFTDLEKLIENCDSPFISSRHYLYSAFSAEAGALGAKTIFDGCFGELGPTFDGRGGFAEMFANLEWRKLWRELRSRKAIYGDSIGYNVRAEVINPLLPQFLINLRRGGAPDEVPLNQHSFLQKDFARGLLTGIEPGEGFADRTASNHWQNQLSDVIFIQKKISENTSTLFGKQPVEIRYPFLDKRLIEFTLAVPVDLKIRNGYSRYLIRAALDKILPPEIQWRTSKMAFSPDYYRRFNKQIGGIRDLLAGIRPNDPVREVLNIEKIKKWAHLPVSDTGSHTDNESIALDALPQAVYLLFFLRTFPEFRL